jgi:hypothetical protein
MELYRLLVGAVPVAYGAVPMLVGAVPMAYGAVPSSSELFQCRDAEV